MPTAKLKFHTKFNRLKSDLVVTIRRRLQDLRITHENLGQLPISGSEYLLALQKLHHLAHSIAGSGGAFGCQEIHRVATALEEQVGSVLKSLKPGEHFLDELADTITELANAIDIELGHDIQHSIHRYSGFPLYKGDGRKRPLVYIVDDDPIYAEDLSNFTKTAGYDVVTYEDLNLFKQGVKLQEPDVIIMDIVFPSGPQAGIDTIIEIQQERDSPLPVIYISNSTNFDKLHTVLKAGGAKYFFKKPINQTELLQSLDILITAKQASQLHRILIIEDDETIAQYHALLLSETGLEVEILTDPTKTLDFLGRFRPDVVIIDLYMPQIHGAELAQIIRLEPRNQYLPLVFLSTEDNQDKQIQALRAGGDDFLTKPVDPGVFVSFIKHKAQQSRQYSTIARELERTIAELEQFKIALDEHAIVSIADIQGHITYANKRFLEISQYSMEDLLGKNHNILNSGYHDKAFFEDMWDTISSGRLWRGVVRNRKKDGSCYWVDSSIIPFVDADGLPFQYVSIRTDITAIKDLEEELRRKEERLRRSQQYAKIGTWDWDIQTGELYWSEQIGPLFGYEGLVETTFDNFIAAVHPDDRQRVNESVTACVEHQVPYDIEHRIVTTRGETRWLSEKGDVVRDKSGKPLRMLGVVQDITDRKQAQIQLDESQARLMEAQSQALLGHWEANLQTGELYWSEVIYTIFGYDQQSFSPSIEAFQKAVHPDDLAMELASEKRAQESGIHDVVHRIIRPNGEVRYVHELARMIYDREGKPLMLSGTVQDITDLKHAEERLIEAKEEAERASKAKTDFLSRMSHELRTPMNAILGFAQLLNIDDEQPLSSTQKDEVEHILRAGWHLLDLINEVLDLARIESGRMEMELGPVDLPALVDECRSLINPLAEQQQIMVSVHQDPKLGLPLIVQGDSIRLKQVILNLLSNAIKYNRKGGSVDVEILSARPNRIRLGIHDTGEGIPADKIDELFEPFNRLDIGQNNIEGTGIGLVISKHMIELMGGAIGVESVVGEGSHFWIDIDLFESGD